MFYSYIESESASIPVFSSPIEFADNIHESNQVTNDNSNSFKIQSTTSNINNFEVISESVAENVHPNSYQECDFSDSRIQPRTPDFTDAEKREHLTDDSSMSDNFDVFDLDIDEESIRSLFDSPTNSAMAGKKSKGFFTDSLVLAPKTIQGVEDKTNLAIISEGFPASPIRKPTVRRGRPPKAQTVSSDNNVISSTARPFSVDATLPSIFPQQAIESLDKKRQRLSDERFFLMFSQHSFFERNNIDVRVLAAKPRKKLKNETNSSQPVKNTTDVFDSNKNQQFGVENLGPLEESKLSDSRSSFRDSTKTCTVSDVTYSGEDINQDLDDSFDELDLRIEKSGQMNQAEVSASFKLPRTLSANCLPLASTKINSILPGNRSYTLQEHMSKEYETMVHHSNLVFSFLGKFSRDLDINQDSEEVMCGDGITFSYVHKLYTFFKKSKPRKIGNVEILDSPNRIDHLHDNLRIFVKVFSDLHAGKLVFDEFSKLLNQNLQLVAIEYMEKYRQQVQGSKFESKRVAKQRPCNSTTDLKLNPFECPIRSSESKVNEFNEPQHQQDSSPRSVIQDSTPPPSFKG